MTTNKQNAVSHRNRVTIGRELDSRQVAWSFRKRIKVIPGVYINLSKSGISANTGVRGAAVIAIEAPLTGNPEDHAPTPALVRLY